MLSTTLPTFAYSSSYEQIGKEETAPNKTIVFNEGNIVLTEINSEIYSESDIVAPLATPAHAFSETSLGGVYTDYTKLNKSSTYNITIAREAVDANEDLINKAADAFATAVGVFCGWAGLTVSHFLTAARTSVEAQAFNDADANAASMKITQYENPTLSVNGNKYYRYVVAYYSQQNCVGYIGTEDYYEVYIYN